MPSQETIKTISSTNHARGKVFRPRSGHSPLHRVAARTGRLKFNGAAIMTAQRLKANDVQDARPMRPRQGGLRSALVRVIGRLDAACARARARYALGELSDHTLHDIGLTWIHGYRECRTPLRHE
jgi:uncharacterized protein YjiS (DUF1127 family)